MSKETGMGLSNSISISAEGLQSMLSRPTDPKYPMRHIAWTDDFTVELPIKKSVGGIGSIPSSTLIDEFRIAVVKYANQPAQSVKRNGKWVIKLLCRKLLIFYNTSTFANALLLV